MLAFSVLIPLLSNIHKHPTGCLFWNLFLPGGGQVPATSVFQHLVSKAPLGSFAVVAPRQFISDRKLKNLKGFKAITKYSSLYCKIHWKHGVNKMPLYILEIFCSRQ